MTACLPTTERLEQDLRAAGHAVTPPLLTAAECAGLRALFDQPDLFRKTVDMGRHAYGSGLYRYFDYPLPEPVARLRSALYAELAPVAGRMAADLRRPRAYPPDLEGYLAECHAAGQRRATPLMLSYGPGDYNRLHQDLYGAEHFPLQAVIGLNKPGGDYEGGEFLLMENRPRQQSIGTAVAIPQGAAVIFPVAERPAPGARGYVKAAMRHGVSRVRSGNRLTLGLIFHDATK
ncbi:2OG-Fe(II) oxygenase [Marinibaculum pumilum]|uniref:2OG-Fe(II) oxygenase n=1 Tax=Marinibaculum pumilum TaxID=1766165 RepID=A0ABV7L9C5_9PROT